MTASVDLSELQLAVMNVLWAQREATAAEVHVALAGRGLAITTVSTLLTRLEKRGVVSHRAEGRVFVYKPTVTSATYVVRCSRHSWIRRGSMILIVPKLPGT